VKATSWAETTCRVEDRVISPEHADILLRAAGVAPSLHNSQPWEFAVGATHAEVYADASRQLRNADPTGRSLLISCGAAVFNLRVALAHLGFRARPRLLPHPDEPTLVASVEVDTRQRPDDLDRFYDTLPARRTNRQPFQDRPLPRPVVAALSDAAQIEGAALNVSDDSDDVARIVRLLNDADMVERTEPSRVEERARWVGVGRTEGDAGIPSESLGPRPIQLGTPLRDLGSARSTRDHAAFEKAPTLAILSTRSDQPVDWIRAGQALERVLLEATSAGISASFMNQPLEQDDLRWLVRNPLTGSGHSHMILRLGYGPPVPATPRRQVQVRRETHFS
jgi:hypothetical protein